MTVWLLPGQGAQKPGMGADLLELPVFEETFAIGSEVLGLDLAALARSGSEGEVNRAFNAQVLTMAVSVGTGRVLLEAGCEPSAIVGFSLGQISGLALSGMLSVRDAFELLKVRAQSMERACAAHPGAMSALLKADAESAEALCQRCAQGGVLLAANYNCPGQIVISGEEEAIGRAEAAWAENGGRFARLNTAGGFHSPLMEEASRAVAAACEGLRFDEPRVPLYCNTDACPMDAASAPARLAAQVKSPVRFQQSVEALLAAGESRFAEVGFGGVLCGLVKRMDRKSQRLELDSLEAVRSFIEEEGGAL